MAGATLACTPPTRIREAMTMRYLLLLLLGVPLPVVLLLWVFGVCGR